MKIFCQLQCKSRREGPSSDQSLTYSDGIGVRGVGGERGADHCPAPRVRVNQRRCSAEPKGSPVSRLNTNPFIDLETFGPNAIELLI